MMVSDFGDLGLSQRVLCSTKFGQNFVIAHSFLDLPYSALGTHVSKVRSVNMDSWSPEQLGLMKCGGNKQCVKFLKQHGLRRHHTVTERYDCAVAMWYQQILKARRDGTEEPKEMPNYKPTRRGLLRKDSIRGLGSSSPHRASLSGRSLSASAHGSLTTPAPKNFVTATKSTSTPRTKAQSFQDKGGRIESGLQERGKLLEVAVMDSARNLFRRMSFGVSTSSSSGIDVAAAEEAVEDANEEEETKTAATSQESFGKDGQGENSESSSEGEFGQESISMVDGGKEEEQ